MKKFKTVQGTLLKTGTVDRHNDIITEEAVESLLEYHKKNPVPCVTLAHGSDGSIIGSMKITKDDYNKIFEQGRKPSIGYQIKEKSNG